MRSRTSPIGGDSTSASAGATRSVARTWHSNARIVRPSTGSTRRRSERVATDNGAPGIRAQYDANYYAAYVLDPDGNNIEGVCHKAPT